LHVRTYGSRNDVTDRKDIESQCYAPVNGGKNGEMPWCSDKQWNARQDHAARPEEVRKHEVKRKEKKRRGKG